MKSEFDPELISAYLDGELTSQSDSELVEQHLAATSADARMLDDFRQMGALLRELPRESAPAGLHEAVRQQIERQTLLSGSQKQPRRFVARSRLFQMVASISLLMLISTVGTFYYMSQRMTPNIGTTDLAMMERSAPDSAMETDHVVAESSDAGTSALSGSAESNFAAEGEKKIAMDAQGGIEDENRLSVAASDRPFGYPNGSRKMSKAVRAAPALKAMRAAKPAPAAVAARTEEIPPLPAVLSKKSIEYINTLANSPKLQGILEPGELVRYVTSNTITQDVSVVELSVVDVEEAFGTIQVLLSNNEIVPASQIQIAGRDENEKSSDKKPADSGKPLTEKQKKREELMALYVEASQEQILGSLVQLDGLKDIRQVHVGSVPNLEGTSYDIEPVADNTVGLQRFEIDRQTAPFSTSSIDKNVNKNKSDQLAKTGTAPREKNRNHRSTSVPHWKVLVQNASPEAKIKITRGRKKRLSPAEAKGGDKKTERSAGGPLVADSTNSNSYQIAVRLFPNTVSNTAEGKESQVIAKTASPAQRGIALNQKNLPEPPSAPASSFSPESASGKPNESDDSKTSRNRQNSQNRLRLLLIVSLVNEP